MPAFAPADGVVLVTGAGGFIASHVIQQLQLKGYRVRATLRSLAKDPKLTDDLRRLVPNARHPLELVEADLISDKGWDEAVAGCVGIFHIAAVVAMNSPNPEKEIYRPSIDGVKNVFEAARRSKTVKKIVMTSSNAAVYHAAKAGKVYTEADWNTESTLKTAPYNFSKTQAEKWAWDFVKNLPEAEKIELETINPAMVIGPMLLNKEVMSISVVTRMLNGELPFMPRFGFGLVDVRDVAEAHVTAYEHNLSGNRYLLVSESLYMSDMAKVIARYWPNRPVPTGEGPYWFFFLYFLLNPKLTVTFLNENWNSSFVADNSRSRTLLHINYRSAEEALRVTADSLLQHGQVPPHAQMVAKARAKSIALYSVAVVAIGLVAYVARRLFLV